MSVLHHTVIIPQPSPPSLGLRTLWCKGSAQWPEGAVWPGCPVALLCVASWSLENGRMAAVSVVGAAGVLVWPALAGGVCSTTEGLTSCSEPSVQGPLCGGTSVSPIYADEETEAQCKGLALLRDPQRGNERWCCVDRNPPPQTACLGRGGRVADVRILGRGGKGRDSDRKMQVTA